MLFSKPLGGERSCLAMLMSHVVAVLWQLRPLPPGLEESLRSVCSWEDDARERPPSPEPAPSQVLRA